MFFKQLLYIQFYAQGQINKYLLDGFDFVKPNSIQLLSTWKPFHM